jgi:hypothetical protein
MTILNKCKNTFFLDFDNEKMLINRIFLDSVFSALSSGVKRKRGNSQRPILGCEVVGIFLTAYSFVKPYCYGSIYSHETKLDSKASNGFLNQNVFTDWKPQALTKFVKNNLFSIVY